MSLPKVVEFDIDEDKEGIMSIDSVMSEYQGSLILTPQKQLRER